MDVNLIQKGLYNMVARADHNDILLNKAISQNLHFGTNCPPNRFFPNSNCVSVPHPQAHCIMDLRILMDCEPNLTSQIGTVVMKGREC